MDTIHQTEEIKWELWKVVYGIWNYIKNSGNFPEAETLTLEWVGTIPGKRESRRFEGDYIMTQHDLIKQLVHEDAVAYGGWSIDLHPADGVFSERPGCNQWHSKGIFQIPYRCLYSRNIENLFLAGRIISVSHVAFGATRVMATAAYAAQAVGIAVSLCHKLNLSPREILQNGHISELQKELMRNGQYIPGMTLKDDMDLVQKGTVSASSELRFSGFASIDSWKILSIAAGQLIPVREGVVPGFKIPVQCLKPSVLKAELWLSSRKGSFTPDILLGTKELSITDDGYVNLDFGAQVKDETYVFVIFRPNEDLKLGYTRQRITGMLSVFNSINKAVSNYGRQVPAEGTGVDEFEFWCPQRRPFGENLALLVTTNLDVFAAENIRNGVDRPVSQPNAWVADPEDTNPELQVSWDEMQEVKTIVLSFDTDFDHPMESVLMTHPEAVIPFCIQNYRICDQEGKEIYAMKGNYQTRNVITFKEPVLLSKMKILAEHPGNSVPAAIFGLRCYS